MEVDRSCANADLLIWRLTQEGKFALSVRTGKNSLTKCTAIYAPNAVSSPFSLKAAAGLACPAAGVNATLGGD